MNNILGQFGLGGRLADNIRERQGMAYYAFSSFDPSVGAGPLVVRAGVDPENVERTIDGHRSRSADDGRRMDRRRAELLETRQFLIGSIPRMLETNAGIAIVPADLRNSSAWASTTIGGCRRHPRRHAGRGPRGRRRASAPGARAVADCGARDATEWMPALQ